MPTYPVKHSIEYNAILLNQSTIMSFSMALIAGVEVSKKNYYFKGYRYCSNCMLFIKTTEQKCPFCHTTLRTRPRKKRKMR